MGESRGFAKGVVVPYDRRRNDSIESRDSLKFTPEHLADGWKWEAEMKFAGITRQKLEKSLRAESVLSLVHDGELEIGGPIFEGVIKTWQFNDGLPSGVSARVKQTIDKMGKKRFYWAFKCDPPVDGTASLDDARTVLLKNKLEYEHEASSRNAAIQMLNATAREFELIKKKAKLRQNLSFTKKRASYTFRLKGQEPLQLDADMIFEVNGKRTKKKFYLLEIEDTTAHTAHQKLVRIAGCAALLGFELDEKHAANSTRKFLHENDQL